MDWKINTSSVYLMTTRQETFGRHSYLNYFSIYNVYISLLETFLTQMRLPSHFTQDENCPFNPFFNNIKELFNLLVNFLVFFLFKAHTKTLNEKDEQ